MTRQRLERDDDARFYVISRSGKNQLQDPRVHNAQANCADAALEPGGFELRASPPATAVLPDKGHAAQSIDGISTVFREGYDAFPAKLAEHQLSELLREGVWQKVVIDWAADSPEQRIRLVVLPARAVASLLFWLFSSTDGRHMRTHAEPMGQVRHSNRHYAPSPARNAPGEQAAR